MAAVATERAVAMLARRGLFPLRRTGFIAARCRKLCSQAKLLESISDIPPERTLRNFCIVAHVDHGKSTLSDRLMELTGAVSKDASKAQLLDNLAVERDRGITIKAQTVSLLHRDPSTDELYLLNLIDTPGHVDFSYEVSRSIAACQGALASRRRDKGRAGADGRQLFPRLRAGAVYSADCE